MTPEELRNQTGQSVLEHDYDEGPLLLLAGPGTGKTFSLLQTISHQGLNGLTADDFFEATLTNAAAQKFMNDARKQFPEFQSSSTLHHKAKGILHKYAGKIGKDSNFTVFDEEDVAVILSDAAVLLGPSHDFFTDLRDYRAAMARGVIPQSKFSEAYSSLEAFYKAVDWYDVVTLANAILENHEDARTAEASKFEFLLIDEYQDLNRSEQEFVRLILNARTQLLAVGDDDQSIYSGRYADPSGIIEFLKKYPTATKIHLPVCSRCPTRVIDVAHNLISRNAEREEKPKLIALPTTDERASSGLVLCVNTKSERAEERFLGAALDLFVSAGVCQNDILVLCLNTSMGSQLYSKIKSNYPKLALENSMQAEQNGAKGKSLDYFEQFLQEPHRNLPLRFILQSLFHDRNLEISKFVQYALDNKKSLWDTLEMADKIQVVDLSKTELPEFTCVMAKALELATIEERLEFVRVSYPRLRDLAEELSERKREASAQQENPPPKIRFMTMHGSKGLDADYVFIPFMEDHFSLPAKDIEEQRRLLYVAVTRAKVGVIFTWSWSRKSSTRFKAGGGPNTDRKASKFLSECRVDPTHLGMPYKTPTPEMRAFEIIESNAKYVVKWDEEHEQR